MIDLTVNGRAMTIAGASNIVEFLRARGIREALVVVEHNGEIVPRGCFGDVVLQAGDTVEIVQMMAGG